VLTTGLVLVAGEITTTARLDIPEIVRSTIRRVGYTADYGFDGDPCAVLVALDRQSPDISQGVDMAHEARHPVSDSEFDRVGAGGRARVGGEQERPRRVTQQVAAWPVPAWLSRLTVPFRLSENVARAFGPASAITRWPNGSKEIANGTVPGSAFTVGLTDRSPPKPTPNTSMSLPLPLVVTTNWLPSGVKATCPGAVVNGNSSRSGVRC